MFKGFPRIDSHPEFPDDVFKGAEPHHGPGDDLPSDVFAGAEPRHGRADALPSDVFQGVVAIDRHPSIPADVFAGTVPFDRHPEVPCDVFAGVPPGEPGLLTKALSRAFTMLGRKVDSMVDHVLHPFSLHSHQH
ncbi:hypothetical protein HYH03_002572 [Edaphochlamys debaryana]|uniref:Uncharacterized protein n=1 Tax=Edaphochlamys debaryana TaxID=47281 RepID=A0A836C555_9CHLO|nr:hypothetical protein HYH03_002572 [Edaphochlamys debaryana]|eukprot:KAG2499633.1 hypothetical protein HYH03_002572 [Edaphochlamys debaryana]